MLEELSGKILKIADNKKIFSIPNFLAVQAIIELEAMIRWLFEDATRDLKTTEANIKARRKKLGLGVKENIDEWDLMSIRLGSRTLSYINHLYVLEGLLIKEYRETIRSLREIGVSTLSIEDREKHLKSQSDIFSPINTFRNKVAGHTAYASPKNDPPEVLVASLMNLVPRNGRLILGTQVFMGGYSNSLPPVSVLNYEVDKGHHNEWFALFEEILNPIVASLPKSIGEYRISLWNKSNHN